MSQADDAPLPTAIPAPTPGFVLEMVPAPAMPKACPRCEGGRHKKNGFYTLEDGTRQQRYRCLDCGRSFSATTGTPLAYLKKRESWHRMVAIMPEALPLRAMAVALQVTLPTAFRWRHRLLGACCRRPQPALVGRVGVTEAHIPYSEKGSRTGIGPGSYGSRDGARKGFRRYRDGAPSCVLLAESAHALAFTAICQGRPRVPALEEGLHRLLGRGAAVFAFGLGPYEEACSRLGVPFHDGPKVWCEENAQLAAGDQNARKTPYPSKPYLWLRRFRGIATRYLNHYIFWYQSHHPKQRHALAV